MATFRFRLAPVLRHRGRVRDQRRSELRSLAAAKEHLVGEIERLEGLLAAAADEMDRRRQDLMAAADVRLRGTLLAATANKIDEKRRLVSILESKLEEKRREVVAADQAVKTLERLRAKRLESHRLIEARKEQILTDDAGRRKRPRPNR